MPVINSHRLLMESNAIEGIRYSPSEEEVSRYEAFLDLTRIRLADVEEYVRFVSPGASLRTANNQLVTVGKHVPPKPGMAIMYSLQNMLDELNARPNEIQPFDWHCNYQSLHPFTDGNGRSGRAIYVWHCLQRQEDWLVTGRDFLHEWYYRSLDASRG